MKTGCIKGTDHYSKNAKALEFKAARDVLGAGFNDIRIKPSSDTEGMSSVAVSIKSTSSGRPAVAFRRGFGGMHQAGFRHGVTPKVVSFAENIPRDFYLSCNTCLGRILLIRILFRRTGRSIFYTG